MTIIYHTDDAKVLSHQNSHKSLVWVVLALLYILDAIICTKERHYL